MTQYSHLVNKILSLPGIGRKKAYKIMNEHRDSFDLFGEDTFAEVIEGIINSNKEFPKLTRDHINTAIEKGEKISEESEVNGIKSVTIFDNDYPHQLRNLRNDPPIIINYKGDLTAITEKKSCAVIGTREPSEYGKRIGVRIGERLALNGVVVVSGLAKGCDAAGHIGCLQGNGVTVAVLAHGLNKKIYPKENRELADKILDRGGLWISEYAPNQPPSKNSFVERDRIQAGLSNAIFVVETGVTGGTMHTVKFAREANRPVFAFDHPDKFKQFDKALGNQHLIKTNFAFPVGNEDAIGKFLSMGFKITQDLTSSQPMYKAMESFTFIQNHFSNIYKFTSNYSKFTAFEKFASPFGADFLDRSKEIDDQDSELGKKQQLGIWE